MLLKLQLAVSQNKAGHSN